MEVACSLSGGEIMTDPTGHCGKPYPCVVVVRYYAKWISQEIGNVQARSAGDVFSTPEVARQHMGNSWGDELPKEKIPPVRSTLPIGQEIVHGVDRSKIIVGYHLVPQEIFSEDGGVTGKLLGQSVKIRDRQKQ